MGGGKRPKCGPPRHFSRIRRDLSSQGRGGHSAAIGSHVSTTSQSKPRRTERAVRPARAREVRARECFSRFFVDGHDFSQSHFSKHRSREICLRNRFKTFGEAPLAAPYASPPCGGRAESNLGGCHQGGSGQPQALSAHGQRTPGAKGDKIVRKDGFLRAFAGRIGEACQRAKTSPWKRKWMARETREKTRNRKDGLRADSHPPGDCREMRNGFLSRVSRALQSRI